MMIAALSVLLVTNPMATMNEMINASSGALKLCIELCGVYAVWLGLLELISASGLADKLSKLLHPIIKKLFKVDNKEIEKMIALNMSANILGLGNAATPMGMKAIEQMDDHSGIATPAIIMLVIVNATSIQLLPSTVIGLRAAAGSVNPADIILPTLLSTFVTTGVGVTLGLLLQKIYKRRKR